MKKQCYQRRKNYGIYTYESNINSTYENGSRKCDHSGRQADFPGIPKRENKPYKTLYLLHGVLGSYVDWVNGTRIQRFAEMNDLVVVMPSGENSFYVDSQTEVTIMEILQGGNQLNLQERFSIIT